MGNIHRRSIEAKEAQVRSQKTNSTKQSLNPVKPQKISSLIIYKTKWRCLTSTDLTYINKYKPKMLSTIHLTHIDYSNIGIRGLKTLCKSLKNTKRVSSLIIDPKDLKTKQLPFKHLLHAINRWKKLEFHFHQPGFNLTSEKIKGLSRIRRYQDLSNLAISIHHGVIGKIINHLSQQTQGLTKLKKLSFSSPQASRILGDMDYTSIFHFKYPSSLSSITLNLANTGLIYQKLLDLFILNIQRLSFLENLSLNFFMPTDIEPQFWEKFFQKIHQIKSLKICKIFDGTSKLLENQAFFQNFSHLRNLISLDFTLFDSSGEHQVHILTSLLSLLFHHLSFCQNLKSFNLSFTVRVTDYNWQAELQDTFPSMKYLTQLEEFQLNFVFPVETKTIFLQSFVQSLQHLNNLKNLKLTLQRFDISHEIIILLANSLQKLTHLEILDLCFHNFDLDYTSMEILSKSISHLNLTFLFVDLGKSRWSSQSILKQIRSLWEDTHRLTEFFSALYGFSLLSVLRLDLSSFEISIPEYKHFSLALRELRQLQKLFLILPAVDSSNNFGTLQSLISSLTKMSKLTYLFLEFLGRGLGSKGVYHIASNIGECKSLETLELHFLFANQFDKKCLQFLFCKIAQLRSLKILDLFFGGRTFDALEVFRLLRELTALRNLEVLEAYFSAFSSPKILGNAPYALIESLKNHSNFGHLVKFEIK